MRTAFMVAIILGSIAGVALNVRAGPPCKRYAFALEEGQTQEDAQEAIERVTRTNRWACDHPFQYRALLFLIGLVPFVLLTAVGSGVIALIRRTV